MIKKTAAYFLGENNKRYNYDFYIGTKFDNVKKHNKGIKLIKEINVDSNHQNEIINYVNNPFNRKKFLAKSFFKNLENLGYTELGSISYNIRGQIAETMLYRPKFYIGDAAEGLDDKLEIICLNDLRNKKISHVTISHRFNHGSRIKNNFNEGRIINLTEKLEGNKPHLIEINKFIKILENL